MDVKLDGGGFEDIVLIKVGLDKNKRVCSTKVECTDIR